MKDGAGADPPPVSRQDLYQDYVDYYVEGAEVKPCGDAALLEKAAQFLLRAPEPTETFTIFPFYRALLEAPNTDCRKHLRALSKATEILETLCLNLFLQPWKKEIKTLKTFTGPFVYCLLPALSSSTIQTVLASIGYLPHPDVPQSQYRLNEDAEPGRAMLVGFELLLARVECCHLLELLEQDKPGPQEWLEILQRRAGSVKMDDSGEKKTTDQKEGEEEELKKEKKKKADRKEVPLSLDAEPVVSTQPRPWRRQFISEDKSIMEMQRTYPDLAIRGRRLLQNNTDGRRSTIAAHFANIIKNIDDSKAGELTNSDVIKSTKAVTAGVEGKSDHLVKAGEMIGEDGGSSNNSSSKSAGSNESTSDGTSGNSTDSSIGSNDGGRVDEELSGPQAISLHITLRAGAKPEPCTCTGSGEAPPTAQPPAWTEPQAAADVRNVGLAKTEAPPPPSLSSMEEEEKQLRELAERMGQLHLRKRKTEHKREAEKQNMEKRRKEREASKEEEEEEVSQKLLKTAEEKKTTWSNVTVNDGSIRFKRSSQLDPGVMKEDLLSADSPSLTAGANDTKQEERRETNVERAGGESRGEEEQLAQSYVIVEHHKK